MIGNNLNPFKVYCVCNVIGIEIHIIVFSVGKDAINAILLYGMLSALTVR